MRRGGLPWVWASSLRLAWFAALLLSACKSGDMGEPDADAGRDAGPPGLTRQELMNPESCRGCHPVHYEQWRGSMHAYASFDPVFHAMNRKGQKETAGELGDFCVKCHAPLAVALGLSEDGLNLSDLPSYTQGIGCYTCHATSHVGALANNGLQFDDDDVLRGGIFEPRHNPAHASAGSTLHDSRNLNSARLCGSCHDVITPAGVHLERTYAEWNDSLFGANSTEDGGGQLSCNACHMPTSHGPAANVAGAPERVLHDHHFAAVDVALTRFPDSGDDERDQATSDAQRERVQTLLDTSLGVEICVQRLAQGRSALFVTLENASAGHRFPSGAAQDRRLWVQLEAFAAGEGEAFYSSGTQLPQDVVEGDDPDRWSLHDRMLDEDGNPVHMFWQARDIEQRTLPAPLTRDPSSRDFLVTHVTRRFPADPTQTLAEQPERVTVLVRLQPVAGDVLQQLIDEDYLEQDAFDAIPVFELIPNRHLADDPELGQLAQVSFEWSEATRSHAGFTQRTLNDEAYPKECVSLAAPR